MPPRSNWSPTSIFMQQPALSMSFSPMQPCINDLQCRVCPLSSHCTPTQIVLMAVLPIPTQYKRLLPDLHLAPPSAATIKRSMPQVKHVDSEAMQIKHVDKVMIYLHQAPSPPSPFLLLVMYEQSVLLIQHVDEIIISAHERSMLLIKHINDEANISQSNRPAHLGAPSSCCYLHFNDPWGRSSTSMTRLILQIKHVDDKGGISNLPPWTFGASLHIVIAYRP
ncbi:hypothetical protein EDD17DRAFT_1515472 [Pisolithus thermaeus]|nr:hypothetical protein EDD17DRAFT_1515472 [Pisolithus thermaeus]